MANNENSIPKLLTLEQLSKVKLRLPEAFHRSEFTLVWVVLPGGELQPTLLKGVPKMTPIQDVSRLMEARRIVTSVDAASNRADKVQETKEILAKFISKSSIKPEEINPLPNFHSESVKASAQFRILAKNQNTINAITAQSKAKQLLLSFIPGIKTAIGKHLLDIAKGQKSIYQDKLKQAKVPLYFADKLSTQTIPNNTDYSLYDMLLPAKREKGMYLTYDEIVENLDDYLGDIPSGFDRILLNSIKDKQAVAAALSVKPEILEKHSKAFRFFFTREDALQDAKFLKSIPEVRNDIGPFYPLAYGIYELWCIRAAMPLRRISRDTFYKTLNEKFTLGETDFLKYREVYMEKFWKNKTFDEFIKLGNEFGVNDYLLKLIINKYDEAFPKLEKLAKDNQPQADRDKGLPINVDPNDVFADLAGHKNLEVPEDRKVWLPLNEEREELRLLVANEPKISAKVVFTKKKPFEGRAVNQTLTAQSISFLQAIQKDERMKDMAPSIQNFLQSFSDRGMMDLAVQIMAAELQKASVNEELLRRSLFDHSDTAEKFSTDGFHDN